MRALIEFKSEPYDGPHTKNLITYKLKINGGKIITWHETGRRGMVGKKGDTISGLILKENRPDYRRSKIINTQLKIKL